MAKIRLQITKGEAVRYISHLDYARTLERAIRRAKLPAAYSEGFNPHMKMAFASALALGVTSDAEYMDLELTGEVPVEEFTLALRRQLPQGIELRKVCPSPQQTPALMKVVNLATYTVTAMLTNGDYERTEEAVAQFNAAAAVLYIKESPKGKREIDVKKYMANEVEITSWDGIRVQLAFAIHITPTGSVKPGEVLDVLSKEYGLPVKPDAALIHRNGLFINERQVRLTPISVICK
jgi:radical SAM-linked protein